MHLITTTSLLWPEMCPLHNGQWGFGVLCFHVWYCYLTLFNLVLVSNIWYMKKHNMWNIAAPYVNHNTEWLPWPVNKVLKNKLLMMPRSERPLPSTLLLCCILYNTWCIHSISLPFVCGVFASGWFESLLCAVLLAQYSKMQFDSQPLSIATFHHDKYVLNQQDLNHSEILMACLSSASMITLSISGTISKMEYCSILNTSIACTIIMTKWSQGHWCHCLLLCTVHFNQYKLFNMELLLIPK